MSVALQTKSFIRPQTVRGVGELHTAVQYTRLTVAQQTLVRFQRTTLNCCTVHVLASNIIGKGGKRRGWGPDNATVNESRKKVADRDAWYQLKINEEPVLRLPDMENFDRLFIITALLNSSCVWGATAVILQRMYTRHRFDKGIGRRSSYGSVEYRHKASRPREYRKEMTDSVEICPPRLCCGHVTQ